MMRPPATEPVHWLLHNQEPPRRRIDAQAIVEQAHALVHEGGAAALSMRALAAALGTSPTALYDTSPPSNGSWSRSWTTSSLR